MKNRIINVLNVINRNAHNNGDFRLKNILMNFFLFLIALKSRVTRVTVTYQTTNYPPPEPTFILRDYLAMRKLFRKSRAVYLEKNNIIFIDPLYYDLFEIFSHHMPIPLVPSWILRLFNVENTQFHFTNSYFWQWLENDC